MSQIIGILIGNLKKPNLANMSCIKVVMKCDIPSEL